MPKNADICRVLFAALPDHYFKCNYCNKVRRQLPSSGYGNLLSHLRDKHPNDEADYLTHASSLAGNLHSFGIMTEKVAIIYHWMEWVVDRNMPLSEVDHPTTRSMSRLKPISSKTLKKYLAATTRAVEKEIAKTTPPTFGAMYDGWTCFSEHYVALYIVFWKDGQLFYVLLAIAPLDEADLTAASHCTYIQNILMIFGQSGESLKFFIGDNCTTNQMTATMLGVPLVGCASHRFNLATKNVLAEHEEMVGAVRALMVALRTMKNRAELRRRTSLAPLRANTTRWSSTFMTLERYVRIRDAIKRVDAVYDLVPKPAAHRRIIALVESLKTFKSVCKKLQEESISMKSVRLLFDKMAEMFPVTGHYLRPDAEIVHSPVSRGTEADLTPQESQALEPFQLEATATEPTTSSRSSRARTRARSAEDFETALLQSRPTPEQVAPRYEPIVAAIPPTSNLCERLFSQCKLAMTPHSASLLPMNFEMIVFLRANRKFWDANTLMRLDVDDTDDN
ncbi:hypothetical protein PC128_g4296 [Phytophthora cactorum]|nr:hypothetical protein PC128_g4296 [Phytophthora cactorum]